MEASGKIQNVKNVADYIRDPVIKDIIEAANSASAKQLWYDQYRAPAVAQEHLDSCKELFGLTMTPEQAAAKFQAAMQKYIDEK